MSTIDPFAFSTGLKAGSQFNAQPDPLQREQLKANILDRQLKAQQIAQQTQETALQASKLAIANQEAREDYNSRQALSAMVKTNPDATVNDMLANNILPAHIDKYIQMRQQSDDLRQKTIKNIDEMNSQMIDALSQTDDPAEKQKLHDQLLTQFAREGRIKLEQANREIGQPPDDLSLLKATKQRTDAAMAQALKDSEKTKNLAQARQANAEADVKNAQIAGDPKTQAELLSRLQGLFGNNTKDPTYQAFVTRAQSTPELPATMGELLKEAAKVRTELIQKQAETPIDINKAVGIEKETAPIKTAQAVATQAALLPGELQKTQAEGAVRANEPTQRLKDQVTDSNQALQQTALVRQLIQQHPEIIGPVMGRLAKGSIEAGTSFGFASPAQEEAAARLQANLGNLLLNEARVASPGRTNAQAMDILKSQSASMGKNPSMIEGALKGVEDRANMAIQSGQRQGINTPAASVSPSAAPARAPVKGEVRKGYKFLGGDPSKPQNWQKQ